MQTQRRKIIAEIMASQARLIDVVLKMQANEAVKAELEDIKLNLDKLLDEGAAAAATKGNGKIKRKAKASVKKTQKRAKEDVEAEVGVAAVALGLVPAAGQPLDINSIPDPVVQQMLEYMPPDKDFASVMATSKLFHELTKPSHGAYRHGNYLASEVRARIAHRAHAPANSPSSLVRRHATSRCRTSRSSGTSMPRCAPSSSTGSSTCTSPWAAAPRPSTALPYSSTSSWPAPRP